MKDHSWVNDDSLGTVGWHRCSECGLRRHFEGETPREAIERVARHKFPKANTANFRWNERYGRLGDHNAPTEYLPALFIDTKKSCYLFKIATVFDKDKRQHVLM
jgi:hypothetical protein